MKIETSGTYFWARTSQVLRGKSNIMWGLSTFASEGSGMLLKEGGFSSAFLPRSFTRAIGDNRYFRFTLDKATGLASEALIKKAILASMRYLALQGMPTESLTLSMSEESPIITGESHSAVTTCDCYFTHGIEIKIIPPEIKDQRVTQISISVGSNFHRIGYSDANIPAKPLNAEKPEK